MTFLRRDGFPKNATLLENYFHAVGNFSPTFVVSLPSYGILCFVVAHLTGETEGFTFVRAT